MSRTRRPKALDVTELQVFATALIKYFGAQPLTLNGTAYTPQQFKDKVDAYVALLADAAESKTAWVNRLNAVDTAVRAFEPVVVDARSLVRGAVGGTSSKLAEFGLTPRAKRPRTAVQQLAINEKSAATRVARHTVGPKQRKAIRGAPAPLAPSVKPGGDAT